VHVHDPTTSIHWSYRFREKPTIYYILFTLDITKQVYLEVFFFPQSTLETFCGILLLLKSRHLVVAFYKLALSLAISLETPPFRNILLEMVDMHMLLATG